MLFSKITSDRHICPDVVLCNMGKEIESGLKAFPEETTALTGRANYVIGPTKTSCLMKIGKPNTNNIKLS